MNTNHGSSANDYFYYYNAKGSRIYQSKITGKKVAKSEVDKNFIDKIKEDKYHKKVVDYEALLFNYKKTSDALKKLEEMIQSAELDLCHTKELLQPFQNDENFISYYKSHKIDIEKRKMAYEKEKTERLRKLFEERFQKFGSFPQTETKKSENHNNFLFKLGITNRKDWLKWLLKNHPDKGGDSELCSKVIDVGRIMGY